MSEIFKKPKVGKRTAAASLTIHKESQSIQTLREIIEEAAELGVPAVAEMSIYTGYMTRNKDISVIFTWEVEV